MSKKIKLVEGCTNETLYIDDKVVELNDKQLGPIIHKLIDKMIEIYPEDICGYVACFTRQLGDVTNEHYCEQCHDTSYTYELEI